MNNNSQSTGNKTQGRDASQDNKVTQDVPFLDIRARNVVQYSFV